MNTSKIVTDTIVLGAGPGGYVAALRAAQLGQAVTLVEMEELGGTCLNHGCIPSKALISVGDLLRKATEAEDRGLKFSGLEIDFAKTQEWKQNKVIKRLVTGVGGLMKSGGVAVVKGKARFVDQQTIAVDGPDGQAVRYSFKHCIIATGSTAINPGFFPLNGETVVDARGALAFTEVPGSLLVVGGGYVGVELGVAYAKLGSQVTIVEATEQLLPGTDPDLIAVLMRRLRRLGVTVLLRASASGGLVDGKAMVEEAGGKLREIPADKVLVAVGRRPNTTGLLLDKAGVQVDQQGFIPVDDQQRTNVSHIFAVGDAVNWTMLAHIASAQGNVAAEAIGGLPAHADWKTVPAVVFTDPEIASVGLTEAQAKEQGYAVVVSKQMFAAVGRAITLGESDGLVKLVADRETGILLGAQMCGPEVSELVGEITLALEMEALAEDLALTPHYHPTLSEGILEAAHSLVRQIEQAGDRG